MMKGRCLVQPNTSRGSIQGNVLKGNFLKMLHRELFVTMALMSLLYPLIVPIKRPVCYI